MIYAEERTICVAKTLNEIFGIQKINKRMLDSLNKRKYINVLRFLFGKEHEKDVSLYKRDVENIVKYCNMICDFLNTQSTRPGEPQVKNSDLANMSSLIKCYNKVADSLNLQRSSNKECGEIDDFNAKYKKSINGLEAKAEEIKLSAKAKDAVAEEDDEDDDGWWDDL